MKAVFDSDLFTFYFLLGASRQSATADGSDFRKSDKIVGKNDFRFTLRFSTTVVESHFVFINRKNY